MYSYIARRLAFGALTVVGVSIMVFVVMRVLPGDPLVAIFGPEGFTKLTDEQRANYMRDLASAIRLGAVSRLGEVIAQGNFGRSFFRSESVADMLLRRGPLTAEIALLRSILSWLVGIPVAIVSALKPNTVGRQRRALPQHPVPRRAGLLDRHADRARPAVLVRLSRAAHRRLAVRRSHGPTSSW